MYWVVFSCCLLAESWVSFIVTWLVPACPDTLPPFYANINLFLLFSSLSLGYHFMDTFVSYSSYISSYHKHRAPVFYTRNMSTPSYRIMKHKSTSLLPARINASSPRGSPTCAKPSTMFEKICSASRLQSRHRPSPKMSARRATPNPSSPGLAFPRRAGPPQLPPQEVPAALVAAAAAKVEATFTASCPAPWPPPAALLLETQPAVLLPPPLLPGT